MNFGDVFNRYNEKFNENIGLPFMIPESWLEEYLQELERCIQTNEKFDSKSFFGNRRNNKNIRI